MVAMFVIVGVLLLGFCRGQGTDHILSETRTVCGDSKFCVLPSECINGEINEFGDESLGIRSSNIGCKPPDVCCRLNNQKQSEKMELEPKNTPNCGTRVPRLNQRNIMAEAEFGEFPWLLQLKDTTGDSYYGGASLIHPQIAITAAHSVDNFAANDIMVYAGVWSMDSTSSSQPHQTRSVSEKVLHEQFHRRKLYNDIALLFLSGPFQLKEHINTICLPPPNSPIELVTCYGTGWGRNIGSSSFRNKPKKISLPTLANEACQRYLRDTALTHIFKLHNSFMCAGGEAGKDVCLGDGGSPLVCHVPRMRNKMYQVGIVSWGISCGNKDVPGVYANLPYLRMWVDEKVIERGYDPTFYLY